MIPTTQAVIDAIEARSRTFKARWLKSLNPVEELSCNIMSLTITTGGGGETPVPGALFSSYVNCTVMNLEENIKGFEYYLQIGIVTEYDSEGEEVISWLPSNGLYTVIKTGVAGDRTEFTAVGRITAKCQKAYNPTGTGYPKTIRSVLDEIQAATGCAITVKSPLVDSRTIAKAITGHTCASALSVIASLLGGFVTEDYQGNIVIAAFGKVPTYSVDLTRFSLRPVFTEDPFTVTGLTCNVSEAYDIDVDETIGGTDSWRYEFISDKVTIGTIYNGQFRILPSGLFEPGDSIGFSCSWRANAWYYDSNWQYYEPFNESGTEAFSFTYGTAQTEAIAVEEDTDTGIKVVLNVVYDGNNTIYAQAIVTLPRANYRLGFGISTGNAHYYIKRFPAVSYSSGSTPNVTIANEYMTQELFRAAAPNYKGYSFTPAELPLTLGNPRLEPWDVLEFTEGSSTRWVPCHMMTTTFAGGLWQDISSLMAGVSDDSADPVAGSVAARIDQIASASQIAQAMASSAQTSANNAADSANRAQVSADTADQAATYAQQRAEDADREAIRAGEAADSAQKSAENASEYASRALGNLSTVQSVTETLTWITQHGTMTLTIDTELDPTHVYFVQDDNGDYTVGGVKYAVVPEPNADDLSSYYELSIDESLNNYVATHLAVTDEGLWLIPDGEGNKVLIATGAGSSYPVAGTYIIGKVDGVDTVLAEFTENDVLLGQPDSGHVVIKPFEFTLAIKRDAPFSSPYEIFSVKRGVITLNDLFGRLGPTSMGYSQTQNTFLFSGPGFRFMDEVYFSEFIGSEKQAQFLSDGYEGGVYMPGTYGISTHDACPFGIEGEMTDYLSVVLDAYVSGGFTYYTVETLFDISNYQTSGNVDKTIYDALNSLGWLSACTED